MSEHHSTGGKVPAAAYLRADGPGGGDSISRQRARVVPYAAARGYRLVRLLVDGGQAGDEFHKRAAFRRLLRAAGDGEFRVLVVDDLSRLTRCGPIDLVAAVLGPLREAGVAIDTVSAGPLDYDPPDAPGKPDGGRPGPVPPGEAAPDAPLAAG
jgi:DNA invertase Pin-like site-specific DNA recombinase